MGTKVHCKRYLPGYYFMRDLNEDASTGSWSPICEDKSMAFDGYSEYGQEVQEVLKQTMLQHEAIFRKQVYELHRLYRIQRDLTNELQNKELYNYSIPMETSPFNPFPLHMPSGDTRKIRQMPTTITKNSTYTRRSFYGTEHRQYDCDFLESKVEKYQKRMFDFKLPADAYIDSEEGEGTGKGKIPRSSFGSVCCQNKNFGIESKGDVNLNLGTSHKPIHGEDDKKMDSHLPNSCNTHCLADLNEPIQGICNEEASTSASVSCVGPVACNGEIQRQQLPMKRNLSILGLSKDSFQDNQKFGDDRSLSNLMYSENEEHKWNWLSSDLETGHSILNPVPAFYHEKWHVSSEQLQVHIKKKAHELPQILVSDQSEKETGFEGKATYTEMSKRNTSLTVSNVIEQSASPITSLLSAVSRTDKAIASPSVSSWRKPADCISQVPSIAVQAIPCMNESFALNGPSKSSNSLFQSASINKDMLDLNVGLRSPRSSITEVPCQDGYDHVFQSDSTVSVDKLSLNYGDCSSSVHNDVHGHGKISKGIYCIDVNSARDINLNQSLSNDFRDEPSSEVDLVLIGSKREHVDALSKASWLSTKPTSNKSASIGENFTQKDLGSKRDYSQVLSSREVVPQQFHIKIEKEKGPVFLKDLASTLHTEDAEASKIKLADGVSGKILDFPAPSSSPILEDRCPYGSSFMSCQNQPGTADNDYGVRASLSHVDTSNNPSLLNLEEQLSVEDCISERVCDRSSTGFRGPVDLNSVVVEQSSESLEMEILFENESEVLISSIPESPAKFAAEIDLDAPVILSQVAKDAPNFKNLGTSQPTEHIQLLQCGTDSHDTVSRMAAEAILAMSTCTCGHLDDTSCYPSSSALTDSLLWFSDVVSVKVDDLDSVVTSKGRVDNDDDLSDDGVDFFEAMTLKLTEMKVERCWKPCEKEPLKEVETCSSKLLTQPWRTQRGRQRRDFQKDILPGLVSLSWHEVTEDLQTIGGLLRASGCSWQTGMARKYATRNGWHCQARGRRRPRGSPAAGTGNWGCLLPRQSSDSEIQLEEGISLRGWGKTTRRCRRQRCPSANISAALT